MFLIKVKKIINLIGVGAFSTCAMHFGVSIWWQQIIDCLWSGINFSSDSQPYWGQLWYWGANFIYSIGLVVGYAWHYISLVLSSASIGYLYYICSQYKDYLGWKYGYFYGLGYYFISLYWVGYSGLYTDGPYIIFFLGSIGIPAILAIFFALQIACTSWCLDQLRKRNHNLISLYGPLIFALIWTMFEQLKSLFPFGGFPWSSIAQTLHYHDQFIQLMSLIGENGLSFIAVWLYAALYQSFMFSSPQIKGYEDNFAPLHNTYNLRLYYYAWASSIVLLSIIYGSTRLHHKTPNIEADISIVQMSMHGPINFIANNTLTLEQEQHTYLARQQNILNAYVQNSQAGHINIWPEDVAQFESLEQVSLMYSELSVISGTTYIDSGKIYNSLRCINCANTLSPISNSNLYHKQHLLPFGEYIPMWNYLPSFLKNLVDPFVGMPISIDHNSDNYPFVIHAQRNQIILIPTICYEIAFSSEIWEKMNSINGKKANAIVNVTNDSWFGISSGPYQHLNIARYRAIELGIPILRCASNGISAIIDSRGELVTYSNLNEQVVLSGKIPGKIWTLYSQNKYTDWIFILMFNLIYITLTHKLSSKKQQKRVA